MVEVRDPPKTKSTDTTDYTSKTTYDLNHQPLTVKDAEGNTTSTDYDADGLTLSMTNAAGHTAYTSYDERGAQAETKTPWTGTGDATVYRTTRYTYDEVGNTTRVTTPRGAQTANDDDFVARTTYDELNRPVRSYQPYDPADARYNDPNVYTETTYDAAGRAVKTSLPPSDGQTVRNTSEVDYYANGWIKSSSDAWGIKTRYEYDDLGAQTARTLTSADGSASRTMTWAYYPDGKLKAKADDGVPVGSHSVVTDDDTNGLYEMAGTWAKASATGQQGTSHRTHAAATGSTDKFTWTLDVPADGSYTLAAAWPQVAGAAADAKFTLNHGDGAGTDVNFTANQTTGAAAWNNLGTVTLSKGEKVTVSLAASGTGTVVADAVRLVRDNAADTDAEDKAFAYGYDLNGNLTDITDTSRGTAKSADVYAVAYDGLNQIKSVREDLAGSPSATTSYTYNNLGKPLTVAHPDQASDYIYNDPRNLLTKVTVDDLNDTKAAKVTNYTYDVLGRQKTITKGNGNVTTNAFQADGALNSMREETSAGALVASHAYAYDANGNQLEDVASKKNADAEGTLDSTTTYTYDPVDRLKEKTKTGHNASSESYVHDANANVIQQTVGGTSTSFNYDRNRLLSSTADGQTASYRYDPFGRQTSVVGGGKTISRTTYDGFDHIKVAEKANDAGVLEATRYTYDPLDRTASKTTSGSDGKTIDYTYLGMSKEVLGEEVAGELTKSYQYSPWGERLSQVTHTADTEAGVEAEETGYYGYNAHTDVETVTDDTGKTVATYGYTAYGENDEAEFTGIDKPEVGNPEGPADVSFNAYRFNSKRWDAGSGTYDMGFRDYAPGLNTFTTRDMYNGALADLGLGTDPFTGSRYAFASGNPLSGIELDGHMTIEGGGGGGEPAPEPSQGELEETIGFVLDLVGLLTKGANAPRTAGILAWEISKPSATAADGYESTPGSSPDYGKGRHVTPTKDVEWTPGAAMAPFSQSSCNAGDSMAYYKPLKEGRAQGMQACLTDGGFDYTDRDGTFQIGNETLVVGTPTFPKTTENTPPGAETGSGMDRGHLLARILGGDGDDRRNLVPLYPKANQKVMKKFEAMVSSTTRSDQHTVWYSVTPMYDGSDVPVGLAVAWADVTSGDADTFFLPNSRR